MFSWNVFFTTPKSHSFFITNSSDSISIHGWDVLPQCASLSSSLCWPSTVDVFAPSWEGVRMHIGLLRQNPASILPQTDNFAPARFSWCRALGKGDRKGKRRADWGGERAEWAQEGGGAGLPIGRPYPHPHPMQACLAPACLHLCDFAGKDPNSRIGVAGALFGIRWLMLHHNCLLTGAGYGAGQSACLFQPRLGLGYPPFWVS